MAHLYWFGNSYELVDFEWSQCRPSAPIYNVDDPKDRIWAKELYRKSGIAGSFSLASGQTYIDFNKNITIVTDSDDMFLECELLSKDDKYCFICPLLRHSNGTSYGPGILK